MKKLLIAVAASAVLLPLCAAEAAASVPATAPAEAEASKEGEGALAGFHAEVALDLMSDYVWRGMILDRNPSYQPSVTLSYETDEYGTFAFNYWTSLDLTHKRNSCYGGGNSRRFGSMIEEDIYISYSNAFDLGDAGEISYEIGHYWYEYPYSGKNHRAGTFCGDLYAGVFWDMGYVKPGAEVFWAYGTSHGHEPATAYFRFSVERDFEVPQIEGLTITPQASLAFGNVAFVQNNTGISDAQTELTDQTLSLKAEYEITKHLAVGANINYTWIPSHTLRQARYMTCGQDNNNQLLWGGVSLKLKF